MKLMEYEYIMARLEDAKATAEEYGFEEDIANYNVIGDVFLDMYEQHEGTTSTTAEQNEVIEALHSLANDNPSFDRAVKIAESIYKNAVDEGKGEREKIRLPETPAKEEEKPKDNLLERLQREREELMLQRLREIYEREDSEQERKDRSRDRDMER